MPTHNNKAVQPQQMDKFLHFILAGKSENQAPFLFQ